MYTNTKIVVDKICISLMLIAIAMLVFMFFEVFPKDFFQEVGHSFASSLHNFSNGVASN
ncbi:hypothetical protein OO009_03075 [Flavobacteriaceae bacterium KMM 6897]|nr:hypothetical protein [Flavobacteriaceae bacterium KMM 6897]MEB8346210.1 hypothetical protein [Flavobacteriaceae bacterium KMM 6898]